MWRIQALSSLLALCGVCSSDFCCARPVGGARLQRPLGRPKRSAGRALLFSFAVRNLPVLRTPALFQPYLPLSAFCFSRPQLPKQKQAKFSPSPENFALNGSMLSV